MDTKITEINECAQDIGNVIFLDHFNLQIDSQHTAIVFYCEGLGMIRDPFKITGNLWLNCGHTQMHLPLGKPQVLRGCIGLVVPSLDKLCEDLKGIESKLENTKFSWERKSITVPRKFSPTVAAYDHKEGGYVTVTCPYGNRFRIHQHNQQKIGFRGGFGIAYLEFTCPEGSTQDIARYYNDYLGAVTSIHKGEPFGYDESTEEVNIAVVNVGAWQQFIFKENPTVEPFDGYHACVYIANFSSTFKKLEKDKLIYVNPDNDDHIYTFEEALSWHQFRIRDVLNSEKKVIWAMEHEIRSVYHKAFMHSLVNRTGSAGIFSFQ